MKATIFAKKMTSKDGRQFNRYITTLKKADGTEVTMNVKFREACGEPKDSCPCNIVFDKENANFREKLEQSQDKETGEAKEAVSRTLWISAWEYGEPYVDTSMDEFVE